MTKITITQVSVFLENRSGSLENLLKIVGDADINLLALCIADTTDFGIARMIVKSADTQRLIGILNDTGLIANTCEVVCFAVPNTSGSVSRALSAFTEGGVSIEYAYSFCKNTTEDAQFIMKTTDNDTAVGLLKAQGIAFVTQSDIDKL